MTYLKDVSIAFQDTASLDAFGRQRVSDPYTLFACSHDTTDAPDLWASTLAGSGTATHLPNEASVRMRTTTASGDSVIRQTYRYFRYLPGKSQLILATAVMGAGATNVRKRIGYFDASNGLFFQQDGTALSVVRRSNVTGTPTDTVVAQASWNLDVMNGTGKSGITLDVSKAQIFLIDLAWLGVSRVRMGVVIDGKAYYVHEFRNANNLSTVYMTTANLPVRYEITNTGTASSATNDMHQICSTVVSEGGSTSEVLARVRSVNNGVSTISVTTRRPVLSIRPKATFNSLTTRAYIELIEASYNNTGNQPVLLELVRGGTVGGSPVWNSAGTVSAVEYDVAGSTITGGETVWSGYVASASNGGRISLPIAEMVNSDLPIHLDPAGANPVALSLVATSYGAATAGAGALTWKETY